MGTGYDRNNTSKGYLPLICLLSKKQAKQMFDKPASRVLHGCIGVTHGPSVKYSRIVTLHQGNTVSV